MPSPVDSHNQHHTNGQSHYGRVMETAARHYYPVNVLLELTHRCHLDCVHCYLEDNHDAAARKSELTAEEIYGLIDQLVDAGCLFLTFSGGEIFLRNDTLPIARYARRKGLALRFYTSGTLMTPQSLRELQALHPLSVEFSLYSADHPERHDAIVRIPGSHHKTIEAIRLVSGAGIPVVIKMPIMKELFAEYPQIIRLAQELGVAYLLDPAVTPKNDGDLSPCALRLTEEQLIALYSDGNLPTAREIQSLRTGQPPRQPHRDPDDEICNLAKTGCAISPFGEVYPTLGFPWSAGNIRTQSFEAIWQQAPLFTKLRGLKNKDLPTCSGCEKFSYCGRCCMWALMDDGDFFGPSLWACQSAAAKEQAAGLPSEPTPYQLSRRETPAVERTSFVKFTV